jgi:toxin YoeB
VRYVSHEDAWQDYLSYNDRKLVKRINDLLEDIRRHGHEGKGKPEPLRGNWSGFWSRRINCEHRLVYRIRGEDIEIAACRYHYSSR